MTIQQKALLLAGLHLLLVASLGGKLLFDRATRPRFWVKAGPVDPDMPIRGRYVSLRVEVPVTGATLPARNPRSQDPDPSKPWPSRLPQHHLHVDLEAGSQGLVARAHDGPDPKRSLVYGVDCNATLSERMRGTPETTWVVELDEAIPFFLPEHVPDPSRRPAGEEVWVEVTLPKKGPLRPIRLGVKKDGILTPMAF